MPQIIRKEKEKISLRQTFIKGKSIRGRFPREALFHALLKGGMTLEASLALPLFLFAAATVLSMFLMLQTQYIVGNSLDRAVADSALLGQKTPKEVETLTKAAFYKELAVQDCPFSLIQGGIAGFSWKDTKVNESYVDASVAYHIRFPINFFGNNRIRAVDHCRIHRWTGKQKDGALNDGEEWVFVTPTQSVYHESRSCSHLKLSIRSVSAAGLEDFGKTYTPCGHCTKGQSTGSTVYVTAEGDHYHYRIDCSGLKRTIYMIKKSDAADKRPCSRCGGK